MVELKGFILTNRIKVLNVAGSRESKEPSVGDFVKEVLSKALLKGQSPLTTAVCVAPALPGAILIVCMADKTRDNARNDLRLPCLIRLFF